MAGEGCPADTPAAFPLEFAAGWGAGLPRFDSCA